MKALSDPTRVRIFEFLLNCCQSIGVGEQGDVSLMEGATAGQVCCHITGIDTVSSTISFHLKELRNAGLITMERQGKYMVCTVNREALARLAGYFDNAAKRSQCC
jgi:ArsR family transcriptional regulator, arsenate/arsenite/antimonite-responsive transcriptional repressor